MTTQTASPFGSTKSLTILSEFLLGGPEPDSGITKISENEFNDLVALANTNHVVVRGLDVFLQIAKDAGDWRRAEWAATAIGSERARIDNAILFLHKICCTFELEGHDIAVIKSLDHWPDLGSDLDLYTNTKPAEVIGLMKRRFEAELCSAQLGRSSGQQVEFRHPRIAGGGRDSHGTTGTNRRTTCNSEFIGQTRPLVHVGNHSFRVPAISDRLMISTLQRMYRHFYFRLCDIVDSAKLAETGAIDYEDLRHSAKAAGIWEGVATYLVIVSDYVKHYRGEALDLPDFVRASARFGGDKLHFRRDFLRVPIMPESATLYASQLATFLLNRELKNTARLSLLPCLATAAAVGQKITGSDKGIW